jgi:hypothetical protein
VKNAASLITHAVDEGQKTNDSKTAFATIRHLVEFTGVPDVGTIEVYRCLFTTPLV